MMLNRIAPLVVLVAILGGCATSRPIEPIVATGNAIARASALNAVLDERATNAPQSPIGDAKPVIKLQAQELSAAGAEMQVVANAVAELERKYNQIIARWYVWLGKRVELVVTAWAVAGFVGWALTAFGSGTWFNVGRWILSALPLANVFSFLSRITQSGLSRSGTQ